MIERPLQFSNFKDIVKDRLGLSLIYCPHLIKYGGSQARVCRVVGTAERINNEIRVY
jgi:hypothetical protein